MWGRLQPVLGGELDPAHVAIIADIVARAKAVGFVVGLDNHSYGYHPAGGVNQGVVTSEHVADVSRRVATAFPDGSLETLHTERDPVRLSDDAASVPDHARHLLLRYLSALEHPAYCKGHHFAGYGIRF